MGDEFIKESPPDKPKRSRTEFIREQLFNQGMQLGQTTFPGNITLPNTGYPYITSTGTNIIFTSTTANINWISTRYP